jgi:signal transduction histidine kinase
MHVAIVGDAIGRMSPQIETALYRAVQEALTNTMKHARASAAIVRLAEEERVFTCSVEDNGAGFDADEWAARRMGAGLGLEGIRERLAAVRGILEVRSTPGRGTQLILSIPREVLHAAASLDRR